MPQLRRFAAPYQPSKVDAVSLVETFGAFIIITIQISTNTELRMRILILAVQGAFLVIIPYVALHDWFY